MPRYEVRDAGPDEVAILSDLYRRSSLSNDGDRPHLLAHPEVLVWAPEADGAHRTLVAVADGQIVGFVTTAGAADPIELVDLFVDPDWMRRGVGRTLMGAVEAAVRSLDATRVEVTANGHALDFYEATGFVAAGSVETRFGPGTRMRLDVRPLPGGPEG